MAFVYPQSKAVAHVTHSLKFPNLESADSGPVVAPYQTRHWTPSSSHQRLQRVTCDRISIFAPSSSPAVPKMPAATRAVLRQSQFLTRRTVVRHSSSTSEAANKASQTASSAASKASEGLSKASAAAGPAISNAATALRKVGGPVGKVVSFVDCK